MRPLSFSIVKPHLPEDFYRLEPLQMEIFGYTPTEVVPPSFLLASVKNGGLMVQAELPDGTRVGFGYGFIAFDQDQEPYPRLYLLGVQQAYRSQGVGRQLLRALQEEAAAQGHDRLAWELDPLDGAALNLSLAKGGAVASFRPQTGRLEAVWSLNRPPVDFPPDAPILISIEEGPLESLNLERSENELRLEIPASLPADPIRRRALRSAVQLALAHCAAQSYQAVGFQSQMEAGQRRSWIWLARHAV